MLKIVFLIQFWYNCP